MSKHYGELLHLQLLLSLCHHFNVCKDAVSCFQYFPSYYAADITNLNTLLLLLFFIWQGLVLP